MALFCAAIRRDSISSRKSPQLISEAYISSIICTVSIRGLLTSSKSLPLFVPLVFSPSSAGTLWICSCERFLCGGLLGSGWSSFVSSIGVYLFPIAILFISIANLSYMEVNFLNQYRCMPSRPGVFELGNFLHVALSESRCIFAFGSSSSPSYSFPILIIHSAFLLCSLRRHILHQNCFVSLSYLPNPSARAGYDTRSIFLSGV